MLNSRLNSPYPPVRSGAARERSTAAGCRFRTYGLAVRTNGRTWPERIGVPSRAAGVSSRFVGSSRRNGGRSESSAGRSTCARVFTRASADVVWSSAGGNCATALAIWVSCDAKAPNTWSAATTSRVFLGVQLQCAQCHDAKTEPWKREQFHELVAFFGRTRIIQHKDVEGQKRGTPYGIEGRGEAQALGKAETQCQLERQPAATIFKLAHCCGVTIRHGIRIVPCRGRDIVSEFHSRKGVGHGPVRATTRDENTRSHVPAYLKDRRSTWGRQSCRQARLLAGL